jgi:D-glycero-alpha-D-manno-heptose-7-phosphate kinase
MKKPVHIINAVAPIRICDNGGWTDTWFARWGKIFNMAVAPLAEVQVEVFPRSNDKPHITIYPENYGEPYTWSVEAGWQQHPLLEAAIVRMGVPEETAVVINIFSQAPAGAGTGTSAAVTVALIGALDRLTLGRMSPHEVAYAAHAVETEMLGQQSGIQDQLAAAYGSINLIEMTAYPQATVKQLTLPDSLWWELERRLALVYLGRPHQSTAVHEMVIRGLEDAGPDHPVLKGLRQTAEPTWQALAAGDFAAMGQAMQRNTALQADLHESLVSPEARRVISIAQAHGALGWKVNGAGGSGGSLTLMCGADSDAKRAMLREIEQENTLFQSIPISLSQHGLSVWERP